MQRVLHVFSKTSQWILLWFIQHKFTFAKFIQMQFYVTSNVMCVRQSIQPYGHFHRSFSKCQYITRFFSRSIRSNYTTITNTYIMPLSFIVLNYKRNANTFWQLQNISYDDVNLNRFAVDCYVGSVAAFFLLHSSFFCSVKRNETKLKYIKSFTFRHFSSEFRFVASVRYNRICLLLAFCSFSVFAFILCLTCTNKYLTEAEKHSLFSNDDVVVACMCGYL